MITFVDGNIFDSPAQVITNTVNTVGVMGKGVALEYKKRYPEMFFDYKSKCEKGVVSIGKPYLWEDSKTQILNFPTKRHWREPSKLEYIASGLRHLVANYQQMGICTLAMPPLGCGNGGLNWSEVKALMMKYLADLPDIEVFVYQPRKSASGVNPKAESDEQASTAYTDRLVGSPLQNLP